MAIGVDTVSSIQTPIVSSRTDAHWRPGEIAQHAPQSPVTVGTVHKPSNDSALIGGHVYAVEKVWKNADGVPL